MNDRHIISKIENKGTKQQTDMQTSSYHHDLSLTSTSSNNTLCSLYLLDLPI